MALAPDHQACAACASWRRPGRPAARDEAARRCRERDELGRAGASNCCCSASAGSHDHEQFPLRRRRCAARCPGWRAQVVVRVAHDLRGRRISSAVGSARRRRPRPGPAVRGDPARCLAWRAWSPQAGSPPHWLQMHALLVAIQCTVSLRSEGVRSSTASLKRAPVGAEALLRMLLSIRTGPDMPQSTSVPRPVVIVGAGLAGLDGGAAPGRPTGRWWCWPSATSTKAPRPGRRAASSACSATTTASSRTCATRRTPAPAWSTSTPRASSPSTAREAVEWLVDAGRAVLGRPRAARSACT